MIDHRAVSTVLGYVLTLGITTVLISGLFMGAGDYVQDQQERVVRSEFEVLGNRLAADIASVDRLALATGSGGEARLRTDLPQRAAGKPYELTIEPSALTDVYLITVDMDDPQVSIEVRVRSATPVANGTVSGGDVLVVYDGSQLEVRDV